MLSSIRKFSKTFFAKILLVIVIIPFVFWGMGGVFSSGNTNSLAKINNVNISTEDFIDHINNLNINEEIIREKINENILEEILTALISKELLALEIKDLNIFISDKTLVEKIKKNKNFLDENNSFSRTKYEKFLLTNNYTAPSFEKELKINELQKNLFEYISGGIRTPLFIANKTYKNETKKIKIKYINLENIYKAKDSYQIKEINNFITDNKDKLKKDYLDFSYVKITPNNLIDSNEYNNDFFNKIDDIENKISNNVEFENLISEYKLTKNSIKNFVPTNDEESIENKIYELRKDDNFALIDQDEYYLLFKIEKVNSRLPNINDKKFVEDVRKILFQKGKYEYNKNLLDKINKKNFNDNEFKKIANADQSKIQDLTFNSVRDNKTFSIDSVKIIYSLPINSYTLIADDNDNIYIAKIIKEDFIEVSKTDKMLDIYKEQSSTNIKKNLYSSYDIFLNSKYNIKINEKTIERVKNYFK